MLVVSQLVKKFPHFIKPRNLLPLAQESVTFPSHKPAGFSPLPNIISWRSVSLLFSNVRPGLPNCLTHSGFSTETEYFPVIYKAENTPHPFDPEILIILLMLGDVYKQIAQRPPYQIICSFLLLTPPKIKIFSPTPFSHTISGYLINSMFRALIRCIKYFKRTNKCSWIYECNFIA
jgi:hypothetical protein